MKCRFIIAVIIFILLIICGVLQEIYVVQIFNELSNRCSEIVSYDDVRYDLTDITQLHKWWLKHLGRFEAILPNYSINEIEMLFGELIGAVAAEDYKSATALLCRLRETSDALSQMFTLRLGNIL
ncbi:MAG: hypothetical protein LBU04_05555 [Christensenellaceae bacterium]|jgi:hypothetical protein|nr:hypothetical protein [Christensenellaceae bacterium]